MLIVEIDASIQTLESANTPNCFPSKSRGAMSELESKVFENVARKAQELNSVTTGGSSDKGDGDGTITHFCMEKTENFGSVQSNGDTRKKLEGS